MRIQTVKDDEPKIYILFFDLPLRVTVTCRKRANSVVSAWFFTSSQPNLKNRDTKALKPLQRLCISSEIFFLLFRLTISQNKDRHQRNQQHCRQETLASTRLKQETPSLAAANLAMKISFSACLHVRQT